MNCTSNKIRSLWKTSEVPNKHWGQRGRLCPRTTSKKRPVRSSRTNNGLTTKGYFKRMKLGPCGRIVNKLPTFPFCTATQIQWIRKLSILELLVDPIIFSNHFIERHRISTTKCANKYQEFNLANTLSYLHEILWLPFMHTIAQFSI